MGGTLSAGLFAGFYLFIILSCIFFFLSLFRLCIAYLRRMRLVLSMRTLVPRYFPPLAYVALIFTFYFKKTNDDIYIVYMYILYIYTLFRGSLDV